MVNFMQVINETMSASATWIRYFDEAYNACYLYNETTGESLWEDDCNTEGMYIIDGSSKEIEVTDEIASTVPTITNRTARSDSESSTEEEVLIKKKSKRFRAKDYSRDAPALSSTERSEYDLKCYTRFLLINAILIEAPIAVLEGALRLTLLLVACALKTAFFCIFKQTYQHQIVLTLHLYFREILLTVAAIISLAIPGCIYLVYREFSYENDWELRPIPTILGVVDVRRFAAITFGGGALAVNSGAQGYPVKSQNKVTKNKKQRTNESNKGTSVSDIESSINAIEPMKRIGESGQDAWSGAVMWVPRDIIADIRSFVSGTDNNIDSLNIAL